MTLCMYMYKDMIIKVISDKFFQVKLSILHGGHIEQNSQQVLNNNTSQSYFTE